MADKKLIGYARVSTSQQGRSGLGLEGQKQARAALAPYQCVGAFISKDDVVVRA
jgi:hypothetical protein